MGYYTPTFANINSGWYRKTTDENYSIDRDSMDMIWNIECDKILISYIKKYGCFYKAFFPLIKNDIELKINTSFNKYRYYEYYFQNRAIELGFLDYLSESYINNKFKTFICECCCNEERFDWLHPDVMNKMFPPRFCRECYYIVRKYLNNWNNEIIVLIHSFMKNMGNKNTCKMCNKIFVIEKSKLFEYNIFVPFSHVNIFTSICQKCVGSGFVKMDNIKESKNKQYKLLLKLTNHINKIPTQDYNSLYYLFNDEDNIIKLAKILKKLWLPETFKKMDGSFFASLVNSGVLPKGTKKLKIGTMVLALDGHVCFSLIEKEIDDYLYQNNIIHQKEIKYPESDMRCDWEVFYNNKRYFIEYFGLMNIKEYEIKVELKRKLAKVNEIILLELYPNRDWKDQINNTFLK
jgi:hypothetical protein